MVDPKNDKEPSGITRMEDRAMKVIAWVVSMVIIIIGAVLYLEHRHQSLVTTLAEMNAEMRHLNNAVSDVKVANNEDHEKIYKALEALNENDRALVLQIIGLNYCCEGKPLPKGKAQVMPVIMRSSPGDGPGSGKAILPWNIAMKGPDIVVEKKK